jgi:hypothetical protein
MKHLLNEVGQGVVIEAAADNDMGGMLFLAILGARILTVHGKEAHQLPELVAYKHQRHDDHNHDNYLRWCRLGRELAVAY